MLHADLLSSSTIVFASCPPGSCPQQDRKVRMWFLVQVVKGSKHFEPESLVGNRVLVSDTSDMVISGRTMGADSYRFEARKGPDSFVLQDFVGAQPPGQLSSRFAALAQKMGALTLGSDSPP
jgi:hypothetical protein